MVATTRLVLGSTRETVPSPWFRVQTEPRPTARKRGFGPTLMVVVTRLVLGSTRVKVLPAVLVTQTAPSPYSAAKEPGGTAMSATALLVAGSMRVRTPFGSVKYQMLSSLAVMVPSVSAGPRGMVAATLLLAIST